MAPAVLLTGGFTVFWGAAAGRPESVVPLGRAPEDIASQLLGEPSVEFVQSLQKFLARKPPSDSVGASEPFLLAGLRAAGVIAQELTAPEIRGLRERLAVVSVQDLRGPILAIARRALAKSLASPEEALISIAREEERLERALNRERTSVDQFLSGSHAAGVDYLEAARRFRSEFERHHAAVRRNLDELAVKVAPSLTYLLGAPVTGRLVASAGGLTRLARMSGSRIQLLGSRRRPSPEHGPRFGHLFRAPRLHDVPPDRIPALARSLAALAAIAARADAFTRRPLGAELSARRDRRIAALRRQR